MIHSGEYGMEPVCAVDHDDTSERPLSQRLNDAFDDQCSGSIYTRYVGYGRARAL